ncbi:muramoyltetrapeptide carboxypeptidase [Liquorilactobacillus sucicola DSM 21376 = JCM 15457]|uniref:Ld-carboxypeptidase n=1 Tax=Liquorilactobacillus sucicola DSM 21376 = JCM 15457 TaxID=1423806 RepID=A0A023CYZ5_9LACO|nr:LD-carboxypeptidase [Liquorilactobacillus sucicola]KRN06770.1 ld-carboxypeptidase [Liquorilactobacillus sucicola DSM 21376 = JCM 15457]GAJ27044.1 muramoyltetrapeptide carboxypeptidase [Liquorilactobacillus sucicola DSM 21376 = JCM 15457]
MLNTTLLQGDTVALIGSSDPLKISDASVIDSLLEILTSWNLKVKVSPLLFDNDLGNFIQKAAVINHYFADKKIKAIFDVSGGNMSNSLIPYLDYNLIEKNPKLFFGYSDLTAILNAIGTHSKLPVVLFQLKTIVWDKSGEQKRLLYNSLFKEMKELYHFNYSFVKGNEMVGPVIGGNIRCFLKLAGTAYFPDLNNKILFLESYSGERELLFSSFHQLSQLPAFSGLAGVILGTFTKYEQTKPARNAATLFLDSLPQYKAPLVKTNQIGHSQTSKALFLGVPLDLRR